MKRKLLYTFYNNDGEYKNRDDVIKHINDKGYEQFEYTYGFEYRNPTVNHAHITKKEAIKYIKAGGFVDVELIDDKIIHINRYSDNDMW